MFLFVLHHCRTNLLLGLGVGLLGIVTPSLQITLAYLYFKYGHIWSRVLNASIQNIEPAHGPGWLHTFRDLLKGRLFF